VLLIRSRRAVSLQCARAGLKRKEATVTFQQHIFGVHDDDSFGREAGIGHLGFKEVFFGIVLRIEY
jgi:hypothetical protein